MMMQSGNVVLINMATSVPDNNFCSLYSGILMSISATSNGDAVFCLANQIKSSTAIRCFKEG